MMPLRLLPIAALMLVSIGLAGCFKTAEPLIAPGEADFPFETLTYIQASGGEEITLVRVGEAYRPANEETGDRVAFRTLGQDLYLVQLLSMESGEPAYLYGLIKVSPDRSGFVMSAAVAGKEDLAAVRGGYAGLVLCEDDPDTLCIESLDAYKAYALRDEVMARSTAYRILSMK